jgi:Single-stranded DNA binding protein, SSDP
MNPMNPRMNPPRGPGMAPMAPGGYGPGMRAPPPNANLGPGSGPPMGPMGGPGGPRQWQPVTSAVSF